MQVANIASFEIFKESLSHTNIQPPFGTPPYEWLSWVQKRSKNAFFDHCLPLMSKNPITRDEIYKLVLDPNVQTIACITAILAWGGMRRTHGVSVLSSVDSWLSVCDGIREGALSRTQAYDNFMSIRRKGEMKGMGPAFFTKLIFFLMQGKNNQGYIMDQWTGASVNLLSQSNLVKLNKTKTDKSYFETVSDKNTSQDYEHFCSFIEKIASSLGRDPIDVELAMFSEGRSKGDWRNHVVASRG